MEPKVGPIDDEQRPEPAASPGESQPRPEEYGHTVVLGGEPIPCTTWLLQDEDRRPIEERRRMTALIGDALGRLGNVEWQRRQSDVSTRSASLDLSESTASPRRATS
jgi:hypothetical protein